MPVFTWRLIMTGSLLSTADKGSFATRTPLHPRPARPQRRSTSKASSTGIAATLDPRVTSSPDGNYIHSPPGNSAVHHHQVSESVSPGVRLRQWPDKLSHSLRPYQEGQQPLRMPGHPATVQQSPLQPPPLAPFTLPWVPIRSP